MQPLLKLTGSKRAETCPLLPWYLAHRTKKAAITSGSFWMSDLKSDRRLSFQFLDLSSNTSWRYRKLVIPSIYADLALVRVNRPTLWELYVDTAATKR